MSDEIEDFETTVLPTKEYRQILSASRHGVINMGKRSIMVPFGPPMEYDYIVSAYTYMSELAKNPSLGSPEWQKALVGVATGVGASTLGMGTLIAATGPLAPFAAIGLGIGSQFLGKNRVCSILVANATYGDLIKEAIHIDSGIQTGRPVIEEEDPDTGRVSSTKPDTIPGVEYIEGAPEYDIPSMELGGLGMYRFEKDLSLFVGFYGTAGAISFYSKDPKLKGNRIAVGWDIREFGDKNYVSVSADLYGEYKSLEDFFDKTIGKEKSNLKSSGKHKGKTVSRAYASLIHREYPNTENDNDLLLTVSVRHK